MAAKKKPLLRTKKKMFRKDTPKKAAPSAPSVPPENVGEHGSLKLSDTQRLTLNWEGAELRSIKATLRLKAVEYDTYLKKVDPQGLLRKLQAEVASLESSSKEYEGRFIASCKSIGSALGMDPANKWSYDDATGVIHMEEPSDKPA